jgi:nucleotide-binding universal stress UspA family protein
MIKNILCALDGSSNADKALDMAIELAQKFDARLVLFHALLRNLDAEEVRRFSQIEGLTKESVAVVKRLQNVDSRIEVGHPYDEKVIPSNTLIEVGQQILNSARSEADEKGVKNIATIMADGDPAARILACAKQEKVDCIVIGNHGLSDIKAFLQGSVSRKVSNRAECTTISVR